MQPDSAIRGVVSPCARHLECDFHRWQAALFVLPTISRLDKFIHVLSHVGQVPSQPWADTFFVDAALFYHVLNDTRHCNRDRMGRESLEVSTEAFKK